MTYYAESKLCWCNNCGRPFEHHVHCGHCGASGQMLKSRRPEHPVEKWRKINDAALAIEAEKRATGK